MNVLKNMHFKIVQRAGLEYPSQYSSEKCHHTKLRVCSLHIWSIYTLKTSFPLFRTIYVSMCLELHVQVTNPEVKPEHCN